MPPKRLKMVCKPCKKTFSDKADRLMECNFCHDRYCIQCLEMEEATYKILTENLGSMWFCSSCKLRMEQNILNERKIEDKCKEYMNKFEARMTKMEQELDNKCDRENVLKIVKDEITKINNHEQSEPVNNSEVVDNIVKEIKERGSRDNNMVIYNLIEQTDLESDGRTVVDRENIIRLFDEVMNERVEELEITKVIRLGEKKGNIRPTLIGFRNVEIKEKIMKNAYRLKHAKTPFDKCAISHDHTFQERKQLKTKLAEAREKTEQSSGDFIFKVRGPPWDLKIKRFDAQ
jgi:hypothetical protein